MTLNCEPKAIFQYFEEICKIPHGSGNEKALSDYLMQFAEKRGLEAYQDEALNVIIKKPGTPGYENSPVVIIQGHLDMVCVKEADSAFDFMKDPIKAYIDGDYVKAKGTSLGADNGIAVAMAMALLDAGSEVNHPPLEVLLTTNEEVGLNGAASMDAGKLKGRICINLDSEEEGVFCGSCAGGIRAACKLPKRLVSAPERFPAYTVKISGLKGGHSGMEIDQERANANVLTGRVLYRLEREFDILISNISGGSADNAIAAFAEFTFLVEDSKSGDALALTGKLGYDLKKEYRFSDPDLNISIKKENAAPTQVFDNDLLRRIIILLRLIPNGVGNRNAVQKWLVETSNNIGVVRTRENSVEIECALRSSVAAKKNAVLEQINILAGLTGAELSTHGDYPEWEYEPDSAIRKLFMDTYDEMYPNRPKAVEQAIHAGLECGWFAKKLEITELVSLGPSLFDVHSINERISISSTERTWELLKKVLEKLR